YGRQPFDDHLVQRAFAAFDGLLSVGAGDDHLGEHRVELAADDAAAFHTRVHPHAGALREHQLRHRAGRGQEVAARVLAVDTELDGVSARCRVLRVRQDSTLGDAELFPYQVDTGGLLRHRVLDLESGVDLQ